MPCMPHVVHKGIFFSHLDARYSKLVGTTPGDRLQILSELEAVDGAGVRPPNLFVRIGTMRNAPAGPMTSDGRMKHLYEHWFGYTRRSGLGGGLEGEIHNGVVERLEG